MTLAICALLLFTELPAGQAAPVWTLMTPAGGGFSIAMPETASPRAVLTPTPDGVLVTHSLSSSVAARAEYLVSWTDYGNDIEGAAAARHAGERACEALIRDKQGRLIDTARITTDGKPGQSCVFAEPDGTRTQARFFTVGQRFYQVMAITRAASGTADADRFLNSLNWR